MRFSKTVTRLSLALLFISSFSVLAQDNAERNKRAAAKTSTMASQALTELMSIPANTIPESLLRDAKAIAVFPNVVKGAFIVGGSGGRGLISRRIGDEWSAPAMFQIGAGSIGFQIGGSSTDIVMLFMSEDSLPALLRSKFEIGGELSAAGGPVGRTAKATTDAQMRAKILSYSRSRGIFAGISLTGAVIRALDGQNQAVYKSNAKQILDMPSSVASANIPPETKQFHEVVSKLGR